MDFLDLLTEFVTLAAVLGLLGGWLLWRVASLLSRQRVAEMMLRERLALWKARVARETAAAREAERAG